MNILPAIDLYNGCAVRLLRGDYAQMTIYSTDPAAVAHDFATRGAEWLHLVDLEGAKSGGTPNAGIVSAIAGAEQHRLNIEIGGGIRSIEVIERYLSLGVERVILGTAAITEPGLLETAAKTYGAHLAVGVDLRDGKVAIKGWTETSCPRTAPTSLPIWNSWASAPSLSPIFPEMGPCGAPTLTSTADLRPAFRSILSPPAASAHWPMFGR